MGMATTAERRAGEAEMVGVVAGAEGLVCSGEPTVMVEILGKATVVVEISGKATVV